MPITPIPFNVVQFVSDVRACVRTSVLSVDFDGFRKMRILCMRSVYTLYTQMIQTKATTARKSVGESASSTDELVFHRVAHFSFMKCVRGSVCRS